MFMLDEDSSLLVAFSDDKVNGEKGTKKSFSDGGSLEELEESDEESDDDMLTFHQVCRLNVYIFIPSF